MAGYQGSSTRRTMLEAFAAFVESERRDTLTSLRGTIVSYDPATQLAKIKPLLKGKFADKVLEAPDLVDVRVHFPRGGGHTSHFPMKEGDHVNLHFYYRNHDQTDTDDTPSEWHPGRMHDLSDVVATPGNGGEAKKMDGMADDHAHFGSDDGKRGFKHYDDKRVVIVHDGGAKVEISADGKTITLSGFDKAVFVPNGGAYRMILTSGAIHVPRGGKEQADFKVATEGGPTELIWADL